MIWNIILFIVKTQNTDMVACDLILSNMNKKDFENENIYTNFYKNVCEPLYKKDEEEDENNK